MLSPQTEADPAGLRVDAADSARNQMFALAEKFRGPQPGGDTHGASAYAALRRSLGNEDADGAKAEVQHLVTAGGKTLDQVASALGVKGGKVHPEFFTGSREKDLQMLAAMTAAQKEIYKQAFVDRVADARFLAHVMSTMTLQEVTAMRTASLANKRGIKQAASQVGKSSVLKPGQPAPSIPAQPAAPAQTSAARMQFPGF